MPPVAAADQWTKCIGPGYSDAMAPRSDNKTPNRVVRVPDELWERFGAACEALGISRSDQLRLHMNAFADEYERKQRARAREAAAAAKSD
jgi:hypothetical protein